MSQGLALAAPPTVPAAAPAPPAVPAVGYFQQPWPVALILGSFVVFTLPLCYLALTRPDSPAFLRLEILYLIGLGVTHFVITPVIYLQSANLRYFNSTWRKRLVYFVVPLTIFALFDLYRALELAVLLPTVTLGVRVAIRMLDFQHFGRQSYGVLQLFQARAGVKLPAWMRRAEAGYFWATSALLLTTFLHGGRFNPNAHPALLAATGVALVVLAGLFVTVLIGFVRAARTAEQPGRLLAPVAYFILQTASGLLAAYNIALYAFALAMHYVEYHILMGPRCFAVPLDERRAPDRLFSRLRQYPAVFYTLLVLAATGVTMLTGLGTSMVATMAAQMVGMWQAAGAPAAPAAQYTFLLAVFDGLFVFHYFIEMFIWKFSDPHYRQTLGPLYFAKKT